MKTAHVEVILETHCGVHTDEIRERVNSLLLQCDEIVPGSSFGPKDFPEGSSLHGVVRQIQVCDAHHDTDIALKADSVNYIFHIYRPDTQGAAADEIGDETDAPSTLWTIPNEEFVGLWESLVFESNVKDRLLSFVEWAALLADKGVNQTIININRVVLLHGPPGTGKTSLCKALAQKLAIRMDSRYVRAQLIEINSHSLFSKWFSESGKLVTRMFNRIKEIAEDRDMLVCLLIDEVESLTHARKAAMNGTEPSDSIRVVNAVLTQIDQMQHFPNILILTTSNMTGVIDLAFVDRADIKQYIGVPSVKVVYEIYRTCLNELMDKEVIKSEDPTLINYDLLERLSAQNAGDGNTSVAIANSVKLLRIAVESKGLSGRSLRKIPFLALSLYNHSYNPTFTEVLNAMKSAVEQRQEEENPECGMGNNSVAT